MSSREFIATGGTATIKAEPGATSLPTFEGNAYTGDPMTPDGWYGAIVCELEGIRASKSVQPIYFHHDSMQIVGHGQITVDKTGVHVKGEFSGQDEHVDKVVAPAKKGFPWNMSIGANPVRVSELKAGETATVNGREVTGPVTISHETVITEVSFVPLGADGKTSVTVNASKRRNAMSGYHTALKAMFATAYTAEEIDKMSEAEAKAALAKCMDDKAEPKAKATDDADADDEKKKAEASTKSVVKAHRSAVAAEEVRIQGIRAAVSKHNVTTAKIGGKVVNIVAHAIENDWTPEQAESQAEVAAELASLQASRPQGPHFHFASSLNMNDVTDAVLEAAIFEATGSTFQLFDDEFYARDEDGRGRRCSKRQENKIKAELNARYTDKVRQTAHTLFKGNIGLQQVMTIGASAAGYRGGEVVRNMNEWSEIAAAINHAHRSFKADGGSTVSIPNTLANVQNKFLLQGYLFTEQTFNEVANILPVKDLKPASSIALFGDTKFKELGANAQIDSATLQDQAFANQAKLYARMVTLPIQHFINDDLGALGSVPMVLGRGWGLKVNELFWSKWMNPGNDDGGSTAFYATTHTITGQSANSNYMSGATTALSSASLQAAKTLFDNQVDPANNPLGIDPEYLVIPPDLFVTAIELTTSDLLYAAYTGGSSNQPKQPATNIWKGRFKVVMSRYLNKSAYTGYSTTAWYMVANPAIMPVVQIAAYQGSMVPVIQTAGQDFQFDTLGMSMRGYGGIGVEKQNFRGAVKSAGA